MKHKEIVSRMHEAYDKITLGEAREMDEDSIRFIWLMASKDKCLLKLPMETFDKALKTFVREMKWMKKKYNL